MADNFNLREFLIENKMTEQSRGQVRKHFGEQPLLAEGCGSKLEEKKATRKAFKYDINMPAGINEAEDADLYVDVDDDDFIDPEDLPMEECDAVPTLTDIALGEGGVSRGDIHWRRPTTDDEMSSPVSTEAIKRKMFTRLGIDQESFNKFATQALGKVHGNVEKMYKIICQMYKITPKQARFLVDKGVAGWKTAGLGSKSSPTIREDFADVANLAAREQDRYATDDEDAEADAAAPDVFGGLGSTSYEAPEDFGEYDEESIRKSYTSLKNQGISDERAMTILAKQYEIPEETVRAMFRTELGNVRQKAVQVDEPKEKVSTFRMPKRSSAAEKAAAADAAGEFIDDEDADEFVKPGETDDEEEDLIGTGESATGIINVPLESGETLKLDIPENFKIDETEAELVKRLQSYKRPQIAVPYLQRAFRAAQKVASEQGSGTMYLYLCSDGAYHTYGTKVKVGDKIPARKKTGNEYETGVTQFVATIDCSGAPAHTSRKAAADAAKTDAQVGIATSGYGSMELTDDEIINYVHSKAWNAKSIDQKLRDEYFPWSDEAPEYLDDEEIEAAKADLKNETPVDPESEWAKAFATRR